MGVGQGLLCNPGKLCRKQIYPFRRLQLSEKTSLKATTGRRIAHFHPRCEHQLMIGCEINPRGRFCKT
jgi:hypothetical protein